MADEEVLQGYVVDIACLRKYPRSEILERARRHTRDCAMHGHCVESGYGLVDEDGQITLLDTSATPLVFEVVRQSRQEQGIRLRVHRSLQDEAMQCSHVEDVDSPATAT